MPASCQSPAPAKGPAPPAAQGPVSARVGAAGGLVQPWTVDVARSHLPLVVPVVCLPFSPLCCCCCCCCSRGCCFPSLVRRLPRPRGHSGQCGGQCGGQWPPAFSSQCLERRRRRPPSASPWGWVEIPALGFGCRVCWVWRPFPETSRRLLARASVPACVARRLARCRLPLGSCAHTSWERARPRLASGSTREKRGRLARGSVTRECSLGLQGGEVTPCLGSGLFLAGALWVSVLGAVNRHKPFHLATSPGEAGSGPSSAACAAQWARGERP